MGKKLRSFIDGEVIFREGEDGDSAFIIRRGRVAMSKETSRGPVETEILEKGDVFGEVGILNGGQRTLTAIAVGDLTVEIIGQKDFKRAAKRNSGQPATSAPPVPGAGGGAAANLNEPVAQPAGNWFTRLFSRQYRESPHIEVRIVPLIGEKGDRHARNIYDALADRDELNVRMISGEGPFVQKAMTRNVIAACSRDGRDLLRKSGGDILVWGDVSADQKVLHLHFTSSLPPDEDLPGSMNGFDLLPIPAEISDDWSSFLFATVLSATIPFNSVKAGVLRSSLETALEEGAPMAQKPSRDFPPLDRAHLIACLAHILSISGQRLEDHELLQLAAETYRRAIDAIPADDQGLHRGIAQKNLGCVLAMIADQTTDNAQLRAAAKAMRAAIEQIPRRILPRDWAAAQNRLGQILYRLHMADSAAETALLTEAISAFQSAVQVYTRVDAPERWADVMNSYAQAAQILGGQLHDPTILQKAVNACRCALEVRNRNRTPFLWAATQNTLGTALFMMGKITTRTDLLESALDSFQSAHEIYIAHNAGKMARVIARNIEHVRLLLSDYQTAGHYRVMPIDDDVRPSEIDQNWWRENVVDEREHRVLG